MDCIGRRNAERLAALCALKLDALGGCRVDEYDRLEYITSRPIEVVGEAAVAELAGTKHAHRIFHVSEVTRVACITGVGAVEGLEWLRCRPAMFCSFSAFKRSSSGLSVAVAVAVAVEVAVAAPAAEAAPEAAPAVVAVELGLDMPLPLRLRAEAGLLRCWRRGILNERGCIRGSERGMGAALLPPAAPFVPDRGGNGKSFGACPAPAACPPAWEMMLLLEPVLGRGGRIELGDCMVDGRWRVVARKVCRRIGSVLE